MKNLNAMNVYTLHLGGSDDFYKEPEKDELIIITDTENIYIGKYIGNLQIKTLDKILDIDEYSIWMSLYDTDILKPSENKIIQQIKNFAMIQTFLCIIQEGLNREYNKKFGKDMICLSTIMQRNSTSYVGEDIHLIKGIFPIYSLDEKCYKSYSKDFELPPWIFTEHIYGNTLYLNKCLEYFSRIYNKKIE